MAKHITPYKYPGRMSSGRFALNGSTPHSGALRRLAQGTNFVSQRLRRCVASYGSSQYAGGSQLGPASVSGTSGIWNFLFRSGVNVGQLDFIMALSPPTSASATDPRVRLTLKDVDAATTTNSDYYRYTRTDGSTSTGAWESLIWVRGSMAIPAEKTFYLLRVETEDYGRVQSFVAFERAPDLADDANDGVCDPSPFEEYNEILDSHISSLLVAQTELWQHNARTLGGWTRHHDGDTMAITGSSYTSWKNPFDTSTSVTSGTIGATLLTQYNDSRSGDIPCEFAIRFDRTAGTGTLDVRLQSASGTLFSVTGLDSGTITEVVTPVTIVANSSATKYDFQAQVSDASTDYDIFCFNLWEYEA